MDTSFLFDFDFFFFVAFFFFAFLAILASLLLDTSTRSESHNNFSFYALHHTSQSKNCDNHRFQTWMSVRI